MNFTTKKVGALAAAALAVGLASSANAALTYELRSASATGGVITVPAAGGTFTVSLFAKITDTANSEGLGLATINLFSRPINGGIANGGGVSAFALDPLGRRNFGQSGGAQLGGNPIAGDLVPSYTGDGVADWGTAENFTSGSPSTIATNPGSRAKFNRSATYVATDNSQAAAFYTIGNDIKIGDFTITFPAANLLSNGSDAATRFQIDLPRRTNAAAPGTTQWIENVVLPATVAPGPTTGRLNSITVAAAGGPDGTAQNVGFTETAFIDFKLEASTTPTSFVNLVADGSALSLPDLGDALVTGSGAGFVGTEVATGGATKGYVDILVNGAPGTLSTTVVGLDLVGGALPGDVNLNGFTVGSASLLADIKGLYGAEYDVVLVGGAGADFAFDLGTVGVTSLVVVPEPTTMGVLALGAVAALRRRRA